MLPLTKAGNKRVKALFCESAKAIKRTNPYGQKSKRILERQKNASPEIVAYADKTTKRIRTKMSMDHSKVFYSEVLRIFQTINAVINGLSKMAELISRELKTLRNTIDKTLKIFLLDRFEVYRQ